MSTLRRLALALTILVPGLASAQRQGGGDVDAINRLLDRYGALEDSMAMNAQAQLMSADRVWIAQGAGRRTDQATNMRVQQAAMDQMKKKAPGLQSFTEDRDRLIRFYGNGSVAVASFYRYSTYILPAATPPDVAKDIVPDRPSVFTLVLEKRDGDWRIVHTHVSELSPAARN
jgi:hypothetical protein